MEEECCLPCCTCSSPSKTTSKEKIRCSTAAKEFPFVLDERFERRVSQEEEIGYETDMNEPEKKSELELKSGKNENSKKKKGKKVNAKRLQKKQEAKKKYLKQKKKNNPGDDKRKQSKEELLKRFVSACEAGVILSSTIKDPATNVSKTLDNDMRRNSVSANDAGVSLFSQIKNPAANVSKTLDIESESRKGVVPSSAEVERIILILDTDVILADLTTIKSLPEVNIEGYQLFVFMSWTVVQELDRHKAKGKSVSVRRTAGNAVSYFHDNYHHPRLIFQTLQQFIEWRNYFLSYDIDDDRLLECALALKYRELNLLQAAKNKMLSLHKSI